MDALMFKLSGRTAFFKKPEVNSYFYFTYGNVHKVALMGMLGAILGYNGYIQLKGQAKNPEFYSRLKNLDIAICPEETYMGTFSRKIQSFNNSVGYASGEMGGNLIINQQWLDNPSWSIYIALNCEEAIKIKENLLNKKCVYMPYLGSNDHPASITEPKLVSYEKAQEGEEVVLHSLFPQGEDEIRVEESSLDRPFHYTEFLPVGLEENTNRYIMKKFEYTNISVENRNDIFCTSDNKNIVFI